MPEQGQDKKTKKSHQLSLRNDDAPVADREEATKHSSQGEPVYKGIADSSWSWEYLQATEGNFLYMSPSAERITGHTAREFIDDPDLLLRIIHPRDLSRYLNHHLLFHKRKIEGSLIMRIYTRSGEIKYLSHNCSPLYDPDGVHTGCRVSCSEISATSLPDEAGSDDIRKFRDLFRVLNQGVLFFNDRGIIEELNPAAAGILGLTNGRITGRSFTDQPWRVVDQKDNEMPSDELPVSLALKNGIRHAAIIGIQDYNSGSTKWLDFLAIPVFEPAGGKLEGVFSVFEDITARLEMRNVQESVNREFLTHVQDLEKKIRERILEIVHLSSLNQTIVNSLGLSLITISGSGTITSFNREAEILLGYKEDELIEHDRFPLLFRPEEWAEASGRLTFDTGSGPIPDGKLLAFLSDDLAGKPQEWTMIRKNGTEVPVILSLNRMMDTEGKLSGFLALAFDNTDRIKMQDALRVSEARWQTALEGSGYGIWDYNILTGEAFFSANFKTMLGYDAGDAWGSFGNWSSRIHPEDKEKCMEEIDTHLKGGTDHYLFECRMLCGDGSYKWIRNSGKVIEWLDDARPSRLIGTQLDIDSRKKLETSLKESVDKERELNEMKSRFVSTASHEFRTPLSSILITSDSLLTYWERMENSQIRDKLTKINNQVLHLTKIVNDVLHLSKIEEGKVEINPAEIDIVEICRQVIDSFNSDPKLLAKVRLITPFNSVLMQLDTRLIFQVINNLVSNGIKYSPDNTNVRVEVARKNMELHITVSDNGIGIPEADQKHLFKPFFRGSNTTMIQGNGLGLSIVKESVALLGGKIDFKSRQGQGTTFFITFPDALINGYD